MHGLSNGGDRRETRVGHGGEPDFEQSASEAVQLA